MKISIGSDHAGYELKEKIKQYLVDKNIGYEDFGTYSNDSVDYPDFAHKVCQSVINTGDIGIVICGSGNGINITANKYKEIRSALCWTREIAELARLHNDANVLALPARFISSELAIEIVDIFLHSSFEGGRHQRRIDKITACLS